MVSVAHQDVAIAITREAHWTVKGGITSNGENERTVDGENADTRVVAALGDKNVSVWAYCHLLKSKVIVLAVSSHTP
jgi:hypothetical protein